MVERYGRATFFSGISSAMSITRATALILRIHTEDQSTISYSHAAAWAEGKPGRSAFHICTSPLTRSEGRIDPLPNGHAPFD
jgi:hypothetical protein